MSEGTFLILSQAFPSLTAGLTTFASSTNLATGAFKGLAATIATNPFGAILVALGAGVTAWNIYNRSVEESVSVAQKAGSEFAASGDSLEKYIARADELRTQLDSGTLSEEESYTVKSELLSIQQALTESYGDAAAGIDLMNGSMETQIGLMRQLSKADANKFLNEQGTSGKNGIKTIKKKMEKEEMYVLGDYLVDNGSKFSKQVGDLVKSMEGSGIEIKPGSENKFSIILNANATDAEKVIGEFQSKLRELEDVAKESGETIVWEDMMGYTSDSYKDASNILEKYKETYDQIMMAEMTLEKDKFRTSYDSKDNAKSYSNMYLDYADAIDKYNDALAAGDISKIQEAKAVFDAIQSDVTKFTADSPYAYLFDELKEQLNEAAIRYQDFTDLITNDSSESVKKLSDEYTNAYDKLPKKYAKALKKMNLSDVDFKDALFTDGVQKGETAINALVKAAEDLGIITGSSADEVQPLIDVLVELGVISAGTSETVETVADSTEMLAAAMQSHVDSISETINGITSVSSLLSSQGTGKSISIDDFNSDALTDYTSALEYNNGVLQLNAEKVHELQQAKADEAIQTNDNLKLEKQSQYMRNIAEIEMLQDKLRGLNDIKGQEATTIQESIDSLLSENDSLVNQCTQLDILSASLREATGAYQNWLNKQNGAESGDMFDDALGALQAIKNVSDTDSEDFGRTGTNRYKAAVDFVIPDSVDKTDAAAVQAYTDSIAHYFTYDSNGKQAGLNIEEFCAQATSQGLMVLDEASGKYKVAGQHTMEDFAKGLNLALPLVQAMFGEMEEFGAEFNWADEANKTLGDLGVAAGEAKGRLEELAGNENLNIQIDVSDIESTDDKIATLNSTIAQMQDYRDNTLNIDSSSVDDANAVIQYCLTQKQMLTAPAVMMIDASQVEGELGNALSLLQQFQEAQNNLETQAAIGADTTEAQEKVNGLVSEIQSLSPEIQAKLEIDTASTETLTASITALTPEVMVKAGIDASVVEAYQNAKHNAKGTVAWENNTAVVDAFAAKMHTSNGTVTWGNDISAVKTHFTASGTVSWTNANGGGSSASGTAHAFGTTYPHLVGYAHAQGNWGTKTGGVALVGELGREIVVDPAKGVWHTVGDNGAEFRYIPANSIVFNHLQSEALLERGFVNSRGHAYASGTAMVTGGISVDNAHDSVVHFKPYNDSSNSGSNASQTSKTVQNAAKTVTNTSKEVKKNSEELFDFVEIKLNRLSDKTDEYVSNAENATSLSYALSNYQKAINNIDKEIKANTDGAAKYLAQANAVGLNGSIAAKVRDGSIDISKFGEDTQKKIQEYQKWYDKMLDCKQAIKDLQAEQNKLAKTKLDKIVEKYDQRISYASSKRETYEAEMNYRETAGYSKLSGRQKYIYKAAIEKEEYNQAKIHNAANAYYKEYQKQLKNGKIKKGDANWFAAHEQIQAYNQALYESKIAIEEFNQKIRELGITKLQYALDKVTRWIDQLKGILNLKSARGERITEKDYMKQVTANNDSIMAENKLLKKYLAEQRNYEYGSEKWEEFAEKIAGCKNNINELLIANEELKDSIVSARWREFDDLHDRIDTSITEIEFLRGMLSEANFDEEGKLTNAGAANIALIGQGMSLQKQTIADFTVALQKLDEELANGNISQDEYNVRQKEYLGIIRDAAGAVHDYEKELIDLYTTQLQTQNDAIQDEIDLRSEALKKKEEYYQFDKKLRKQTKDLQTLKAQAAALEGVTTAAGKAQLAKLNAQISEAQDNLDDTLHDHEYEFRISGYEDLSKDVQKQLDETIREIEINAELQQQIVNDMLGNIKTNYSAAYSEINSLIEHTGVSITDTTQSMIDRLYDVIEAAKLANEAIQRPSDYDSSDEADNIDTSTIVTDKDSHGNSTSGAENNASKPEDTNNASQGKPPSNETAVQKATSLKLNKTSLSLTVDKTYKLVATPTPSGAPVAITWTTSSKAVATVSGGTVKGIKAGTATITAKDTRSGKSATCKVTVKKATSSSGDTGKTDGGSNQSSNTDIWKGIPKDTSMKGRKDLAIGVSIFDRMWYNGYVGSYANQKKLYENLNGEKVHGTYRGTADQNYWMVTQLKAKGYAKGTTSATPGAHLIDETGTEALITKYGKLVNFSGGETVFSPEQVKNLQAMSNMVPTILAQNLARANASIGDTSNTGMGGNVYHIGTVEGVHVDGSVNNDNIGSVQEVGRQLLKDKRFMDKTAKYVDSKFSDEMKKSGFPNRVR